jgi:N-acetylglucosaminyldiphosphoundecaprenol N-acetyl-beta-D-mannosaminyltransferase
MPKTPTNARTNSAPLQDRAVFGLRFAHESQEELLHALTSDLAEPSGARLLVTANVDHIVTLRRDPAFREAYSNAWRITADGTPVFLYARMRGARVPERVTGSDLFADLCKRVRPEVHRLFLVVSNTVSAEKIRAYFLSRGFGADAVTIEVPPFGFERDPAYSMALADRVRAAGATHLVIGLGAPKSEIWAHRHHDRLGSIFVLCVGAAIEFFTGDKIRAPEWAGRFGLEWLHRFLSEPRRLFHRYFVRSWSFFAAIADDLRAAR